MKLILVLAVLSSVALAQVPKPFDFNWRNIKNIWESPRLQPAVKNLTPRYGINKSTNPRGIVGGNIARLGQFPFHVLLIIDDNWWCGGSIIHPHWVLTAGHCIYLSHSANIYSIVDLDEGYYWMSTSAQMILHENYDDYEIEYDIGLIRTNTAAPNNMYTSYINLPREHGEHNFAGNVSTIQGFGVYSDAAGYVSDVKRYVPQYIMESANCLWSPNAYQLCTQTTGGRAACSGDSGGGLFIGDMNNHSSDRIVVGIVSYGALAGCELGYPDVYTRVTSFIDWIDRHIAA